MPQNFGSGAMPMQQMPMQMDPMQMDPMQMMAMNPMQMPMAMDPAMQMQMAMDPAMQMQMAMDPTMQMQMVMDPMQMQMAMDPTMQMQMAMDPTAMAMMAMDPTMQMQAAYAAASAASYANTGSSQASRSSNAAAKTKKGGGAAAKRALALAAPATEAADHPEAAEAGKIRCESCPRIFLFDASYRKHVQTAHSNNKGSSSAGEASSAEAGAAAAAAQTGAAAATETAAPTPAPMPLDTSPAATAADSFHDSALSADGGAAASSSSPPPNAFDSRAANADKSAPPREGEFGRNPSQESGFGDDDDLDGAATDGAAASFEPPPPQQSLAPSRHEAGATSRDTGAGKTNRRPRRDSAVSHVSAISSTVSGATASTSQDSGFGGDVDLDKDDAAAAAAGQQIMIELNSMAFRPEDAGLLEVDPTFDLVSNEQSQPLDGNQADNRTTPSQDLVQKISQASSSQNKRANKRKARQRYWDSYHSEDENEEGGSTSVSDLGPSIHTTLDPTLQHRDIVLGGRGELSEQRSRNFADVVSAERRAALRNSKAIEGRQNDAIEYYSQSQSDSAFNTTLSQPQAHATKNTLSSEKVVNNWLHQTQKRGFSDSTSAAAAAAAAAPAAWTRSRILPDWMLAEPTDEQAETLKQKKARLRPPTALGYNVSRPSAAAAAAAAAANMSTVFSEHMRKEKGQSQSASQGMFAQSSARRACDNSADERERRGLDEENADDPAVPDKAAGGGAAAKVSSASQSSMDRYSGSSQSSTAAAAAQVSRSQSYMDRYSSSQTQSQSSQSAKTVEQSKARRRGDGRADDDLDDDDMDDKDTQEEAADELSALMDGSADHEEESNMSEQRNNNRHSSIVQPEKRKVSIYESGIHEMYCSYYPNYKPPERRQFGAVDDIAWTTDDLPPRPFPEHTGFPYGKVLIKEDGESELDPLETFSRVLMLDEMVKLVIEQSELFARQQKREYKVSPEEMKAFIGITLVMGYHVLPAMGHYWSIKNEDLGVQFIYNTMRRERYAEIRKNLHFNDNATAVPKGEPGHDKGHKMRLLINHLNEAFQRARLPTKRQAIDEWMVKMTGHLSIRQHVPNKPIPIGLKLWARADSQTGYLYETDLYCGAGTSMDEPGFGLGENVVKQLTRNIVGLYCEIYTDNFFSTPKLFLDLREDNILACGVTNSQRNLMPQDFKNPSDLKEREIECRTSPGLQLVRWNDNKIVTLCSNFLPANEEDGCLRRGRIGRRILRERVVYARPTMVTWYNKYMGGVDLMDHLKVAYGYDRKSQHKYYLRIFFEFIDLGINNSFTVFKILTFGKKKSQTARDILGGGKAHAASTASLTFRRYVALSLIGDWNRTKRKQLALGLPSDGSLRTEHVLVYGDQELMCFTCQQRGEVCMTVWKCKACDEHYCMTQNRNCFEIAHS